MSCQPGTFNSTDGNEPCTPAPPGFFVDTAMATSATPCQLGTFQDEQGQTSCKLAPIGTYVESLAQTSATSCPTDTTTTVQGSTSSTDCVAVTLATTVSAGSEHSCAVRLNGEVACWGRNDSGQLGLGFTSDDLENGVSVPGAVLGITDAVDVVAGYNHSSALRATGAVRCWGRNSSGSLGNGTTGGLSNVPVPVTGISTAVSLATGDNGTSCALLADGTVTCWGYTSNVPVAVPGITDAVAVATGGGHRCALLSDGGIVCWGGNSNGELGDGTTTPSSVPVSVVGIATATAVSAGNGFSCAVLADGGVRCWGTNYNGALGTGSSTPTSSSVPLAVTGIADAVSVSAASGYQGIFRHACAALVDGTAKCWGDNYNGALGNGTTVGSSTPVTVAGLSGAVQVTTGGHSCARRSDGTLRCWGRGFSGQLGRGFSSSSVPVVVARFP